ncbi:MULTISPECIES: chemotaxis protein CheW [Roseateles]|uniref:Chemotaxis protein CheW n=1 Tax=Pelomonas caseinilytica TaxID=2906763 RepID=A0ABS8XEZ2_9BURK|nr:MULTISPECIES: chemotaxis protein CheW [unclassified Roseateles]MCE4538343.1 chemotaxis protein CheW [Pelomonas sp. P7]HEV6964749.1 chemotaxis protein CheW [Roseateles sp.]
MANKTALRELQQRLAERMQAAREQTLIATWLAVDCAGVGLLFPLRQASEIFAPVPVKPVPYAKPWLVGVANLRGGLFTVVDLAVYLGLREPTPGRVIPSHSRLVSLGADLNLNCALVVDRLAGLRSDEQLPLVAEAATGPRPRFAGALRRDEAGRHWQEINLEALSRQENFLHIVA